LQTFENRATLFSLAIASILIINIKEDTVRLNEGGCRPLLEDVLRGMLRLGEDTLRKKRLLLFVLRDHDYHRSIPGLETQCRDTIRDVWNAIARSTGKTLRPYSELFDVEVFPLEDLQGEGSELNVEYLDELLLYFIDENDKHYVFKNRETFENTAELAQVATDLWEQIQRDDELVSVGKPRLLHAEARCQEALDYAVVNTERKIDELKEELQRTTGAADLLPRTGNFVQVCKCS
jgi:hypothetical protein